MSELFGTIKGSYTSADRSRPGAVARARGGTLFIDEIDKLSLETQAGLLRLLDEGVYRPIGSSDEALEANVRFIVGTNVNLWEAVQCGRFRHDLYWRINVFPIKIPPLDERRDEIIDWAKYMLRRAQSADGTSLQERPPVEFTKDAQDLLFSIRWPGNLRQLDNVVRRAYVFFHSDHVGRNAPALVTKHHMQLALQHEGAEATSPTSVSEQSSAFDHLKRAAAACVDVHRRRADEDRPLPPNAPDDFQHLVLRIAMDDMGVDEAMRLFGRTKAIRQRNTARTVDAVNEGVARLRTHFEPKSEVSSSYEAAIHRKHNE